MDASQLLLCSIKLKIENNQGSYNVICPLATKKKKPAIAIILVMISLRDVV